MAARIPSKLTSSKENIEKQCLMDTLPVRDPTKVKSAKPKSHSSICLTSPTENKSFDADSIWSKNNSPVSAREASMSGIDLPSKTRETSSRRHQKDRVSDASALREVPLCRVTDVRPGASDVAVMMVKGESSNELSKKARWIIIITAVVLVLMSILLVGITLRLAPVIDDLVRKENEELHKMVGHHATTPRPLENANRTILSTISSTHADG